MEEHAQDRPLGGGEKKVKSLDELEALAWGVAGWKCASLAVMKATAHDKAADYKKALGAIDLEEMDDAQKGQREIYETTLVTAAKNMWGVCCGPATGYVATSTRLRWVVLDAFNVIKDTGRRMNLRVDPPAVVIA